MKLILKDVKVIIAKFTVESRTDGMFISTVWTQWLSENDRLVTEFETYSAALADMYKAALHITLDESDGLSITEEN